MSTRVPFIDLDRLVARVRDEVLEDWAACLAERDFVGGPRVAALERMLAAATGAPHVVACSNGTDALVVGLQALGVRPGSKVAVPNLTFWATFEAVVQIGATPVLVDVDDGDLQMDPVELASAHDRHRFEAAIFVHLYGWTSARLREIRVFCKTRGVALLEDGAQALGVEALGEPVLAAAEVGTLSFYPAKVVGGAMDGGAITVASEERAALVRSLCNHGRVQHYAYDHVGHNARMGGVQAAYVSRVLAMLPEILESRRATATFYREQLASSPRVRVYGPPPGVIENGYLDVLTVDGRGGDEIVEALGRAGIGAARTYPAPLDAQPPAKASGAIAHGTLPVSRALCERVVNLPLFFGIREDERDAAVGALLSLL